MSYGPNVFPKDAQDLARILSTPNVWHPRSVADEPLTRMSRWCIRECFLDHYGERTRHIVGWCGEGRVCSKVVKWEIVKEGILATTESGRNYLLEREPGINMDAEYVWGSWLRIHNVRDVVDVTDQYWDDNTNSPKLPEQCQEKN